MIQWVFLRHIIFDIFGANDESAPPTYDDIANADDSQTKSNSRMLWIYLRTCCFFFVRVSIPPLFAIGVRCAVCNCLFCLCERANWGRTSKGESRRARDMEGEIEQMCEMKCLICFIRWRGQRRFHKNLCKNAYLKRITITKKTAHTKKLIQP